jgi:transglutaminase-like putative cysteine protease
MPVFNIHHITKYTYDRPVKESVNEIRLYPFADHTQETLHHELQITGQPDVHLVQDYWANRTGMFNLLPSHRELVIESKLIVRTLGEPGFSPSGSGNLDELREQASGSLHLLELSRISETDLKEPIMGMANEIYQPGMPVGLILEKCGAFIFDRFTRISHTLCSKC